MSLEEPEMSQEELDKMVCGFLVIYIICIIAAILIL